MKKTTTRLRTATMLLVLLPLIMISCSEKDVTPPVKPPVVIPPDPIIPAAKITGLSTNPTKPYYGDPLVLTVSATDATEYFVNEQKMVGNSHTFSDVNSVQTYDVKAKGPGGQDVKQFTTNFWSLKNKYLTKNVKLYVIGNVYVNKDSINFPNAYRQGLISKDTLYYNPDGSGKKVNEAGNFAGNLHWEFIANETRFGGSQNDPDYWNIETLDGVIFKIWQDKPDGFMPNIIWRTTLTFRITPI